MTERDEAERTLSRSRAYRLFSYCFFGPGQEILDFLSQGDLAREMGRAFKAHPSKKRWSEVRSDLTKMTVLPSDRVLDEYVALLTLKSGCPPYESAYDGTAGGLFSTEGMADIAGFYKAWGMGFNGERPDHIAAELEFMHLVTMKQAEALIKNDGEKTALCVSVQKKFVGDHLGTWVDAFHEALLAEGSLFYGSLGRVLRRWMEMECSYLGVAPVLATGVRVDGSHEGGALEEACS